MIEDTVIVGVVLLAVVPFVVWDAVSSLLAGFDNAFWARSLDDKMDYIPDRQAAWHRLGIVWIFIGVLLSAGFMAFTFQLASEGEPVWAAIGFGTFLPVAVALFLGATLMVATVADAAEDRRKTGSIPGWAQPVWRTAWWLERAFVIGANLAYVAWGIAIVATGFPAVWAGWVAIVSGALIAIWASLRNYFFQHMALLTPIVIGVALLLY